jgi:peptide chain release factor
MRMLLLSAGKGPQECAYAVGLAFKCLQQECEQASVRCSIVESKEGESSQYQGHSLHHVIITLEGENENVVANAWTGSMRWVCPSPFRKNHKRKNWYFSGQIIGSESAGSYVGSNTKSKNAAEISVSDINFSFCRASGAGGQHVNKTDSAVRAVHKPSGIQVRIETERSQHGNKRIAIKLLEYKLKQESAERNRIENKEAWNSHQDLERGNSVRTFIGMKFTES